MKKRTIAGVALLAALSCAYGVSGLKKEEKPTVSVPEGAMYVFCRSLVPDREGCLATLPAHFTDPSPAGKGGKWLGLDGTLLAPTPVSLTYCAKGEMLITASTNLYQFCQTPVITL